MLHLRKRCRLLPPEELKMLLSAAVMPSPGRPLGVDDKMTDLQNGEFLLELPVLFLLTVQIFVHEFQNFLFRFVFFSELGFYFSDCQRWFSFLD